MALQAQHLQPDNRPNPTSSIDEPSLSFVACHLRQPPANHQSTTTNINHSWGLWVSLQGDDKTALVVAHIQEHSFDPLLQWSKTTAAPLDPSIVWNQSYGSYANDLWKSYFSLSPSFGTSHSNTLLPGDVIVAINGLPISAFGGSIGIVTNYLKACKELFLVAARSRTLEMQQQQQTPSKQQIQIFLQQLSSTMGLVSYPPTTQQQTMPAHHAYHHPSSGAWNPNAYAAAHYHYPSWSYPTTLSQQQQQQQQQQPITRVVTPMKSQSTTTTIISPSSAVTTEQFYKQKAPCKQIHKAGCTSLKPTKMSLPFPVNKQWRNSMFRKKYTTHNLDGTSSITLLGIHFDDNSSSDIASWDPEEGTYSSQFLIPITSSNFSEWLRLRKQTWRSKWNVKAAVCIDRPASAYMPTCWRNPMFYDTTKSNVNPGDKEEENGKKRFLPYSDNNTFDPYDGSRSRHFLVPLSTSNWSQWLKSRKHKWRSNWKVYELETDESELTLADLCQNSNERHEDCSVRYAFWAERYPSFEAWLAVSSAKWKNSYSWNSKRRKSIQQACDRVVPFPSSQDPNTAHFELITWLKVRKNQWRVLRRRRQRRLEEAAHAKEPGTESDSVNGPRVAGVASMDAPFSENRATAAHMSGDFVFIDALLEEEERKKKLRKARAPIDISFLFLPSLGCPDDVVAHCLRYLKPSEHGKLLCINKRLTAGLKSRSNTWQSLCPKHWCLPRRPRKPWFELYLSKLRMEATASQKQWDDLVSKIAEVLLKGDQVKVVMKLIASAQKKFNFTVDYISGVVCERNSILNLAVIHRRQKVVHWLIEQKKADIETSDRGNFTPLINAAWAGDRHLVRLLLSHGADRSKIGTGHYTEALAPVDFKGLTAEGWARKKGFDDIATLIRVGL